MVTDPQSNNRIPNNIALHVTETMHKLRGLIMGITETIPVNFNYKEFLNLSVYKSLEVLGNEYQIENQGPIVKKIFDILQRHGYSEQKAMDIYSTIQNSLTSELGDALNTLNQAMYNDKNIAGFTFDYNQDACMIIFSAVRYQSI